MELISVAFSIHCGGKGPSGQGPGRLEVTEPFSPIHIQTWGVSEYSV